MNVEVRDNPNDQEVLFQLSRILASTRFERSATQSKLLRFVVHNALLGVELQEADIFMELYGNVAIMTHKVRAGASVVRDKLEKFYEDEGSNDLVRIVFPPGPPYTAEFTYNEHAAAIRSLKSATALLHNFSRDSLVSAQTTIACAPGSHNFGLFREKQCEIWLLKDIWDYTLDPVRPLLRTESWRSGGNMLRQYPNSWRSQLMLGVLAAFDRDWPDSKSKFEAALRLNPREVQMSLWYASYLITVGRIQEGVQIVDGQTRKHHESTSVLLAGTILYHLAREHKRAHDCMFATLTGVWQNDLFNLVNALLEIESGRYGEALYYLNEISEQTETLAGTYRVNRFRGLKVLCLLRNGDPIGAETLFMRLRFQRPREPLQFALAYMAFGRTGRALVSLRRAQRQGEIFMNWLHLLPIFDPLRSHPRFQRMVAEFGNPSNPF